MVSIRFPFFRLSFSSHLNKRRKQWNLVSRPNVYSSFISLDGNLLIPASTDCWARGWGGWLEGNLMGWWEIALSGTELNFVRSEWISRIRRFDLITLFWGASLSKGKHSLVFNIIFLTNNELMAEIRSSENRLKQFRVPLRILFSIINHNEKNKMLRYRHGCQKVLNALKLLAWLLPS